MVNESFRVTRPSKVETSDLEGSSGEETELLMEQVCL